ncbi:MAG: hypothetical protein ACK5CA_03615 [Cyanobacteriota bacterium]
MKFPKKILIIYFYNQNPRITILDHLYSFDRYSDAYCYYINLAYQSIPSYLSFIKFDLIIFHTIYLSLRWNKKLFKDSFLWINILKESNAVKIAVPQDEFINTDILNEFINQFNIKCIFSVSPESEWKKIYSDIDFNKVRIYKVLTGYLEPKTIDRIESIKKISNKMRGIDIGYRSWHAEYWLGRHGLLKTKIAEVFSQEALKYTLHVDISTREEDTFFGDDWYQFLLNCKYTIGVEGGSSILDKDGSIRERTNEYVKLNPNANFTEVEQACFPNADGTFKLFALSPRHLEACITQTCQILIEGSYNGILEKGKHYLELKADLSNLPEILTIVKEDKLREKIVANAYKDIVLSEKHTYQQFVEFILEESFKDVLNSPDNQSIEWLSNLIYYWFKIQNYLIWQVILPWTLFKAFLKSYIPPSIINLVKQIKNRI